MDIFDKDTLSMDVGELRMAVDALRARVQSDKETTEELLDLANDLVDAVGMLDAILATTYLPRPEDVVGEPLALFDLRRALDEVRSLRNVYRARSETF